VSNEGELMPDPPAPGVVGKPLRPVISFRVGSLAQADMLFREASARGLTLSELIRWSLLQTLGFKLTEEVEK
jgi:hypothetical protein